GRIAGADGAGDGTAEQGLHALWGRAAEAGNRALADVAAVVHPARRAVFRDRSADREGFAGADPGVEPVRDWRADHRSQRPGNSERDGPRVHCESWENY